MHKKYASGIPEAYFLCIYYRKDLLDQLVTPISLFGGEGDHGASFRKLKVSADDREIRLQFALLQFIHLIGDNNEGAAGIQEPTGHGDIIIRGRMTVVNDQNAQVDTACGEIILHQLAPAVLLTLGHLGEAVSGKIHKITLFIQNEIIHMDGLTGLISDSGKILPLKEPVDHRGFAHIGLTRKSDLRQSVRRKIPGRRSGDQKFNILKIHRSSSFTAGCPYFWTSGGYLRGSVRSWPLQAQSVGSKPFQERPRWSGKSRNSAAF